jgi:hypothetical protein
MSRRSDELAGLSHVRRILDAYLERVDEDALHWKAFPDAVPIAETVLHIAGFEYLTIAALARGTEQNPDLDLWRRVSGGFARSAGFAASTDVDRSELVDTLGAVREETLRHLSRSDADLSVAGLGEAVTVLSRELEASGPPGNYAEVRRGYASSLADDGPPEGDGKVSLVRLLELHECYHRGQITLQGYLFRRHRH